MSFHLIIVSPDKVIVDTDAEKLTLPGKVQEFVVLTDHTPLYAELTKGVISIELKDGKTKEIDIESAICRVRQNHVSIITGFDEETEKNVKRG